MKVKKNNHVLHQKMRVGISLVSLAVSLTSLLYVTYSWFVFNRNVETYGPDVSVDQGLSYKFKYFVKNVTEDGNNIKNGYPNPGYEIIDTEVTDYENDFAMFDNQSSAEESPFMIDDPNYRVSFVLEVISYETSGDHEVTLELDGFVSPPAEHYYNYTTGQQIKLSEAINIYSGALDGNGTNENRTALTDGFVKTLSPGSGDLFDGTEQNIMLASREIEKNTGDNTIIFIFTIEYSGAPSTFYKYHSQNNGDIYYTKDVTGNSNVYRGLGFQLDTLTIRKNYL